MPQLHIIVRQKNVSNLIGSGGVNVKALEKETNTKINIQKDSGVLERDFSKLRNVLIVGEKEDLVKGVVKIVSGTLTDEFNSQILQLLLLPGGETEYSLRQGLMGHNGLLKDILKVNEETSARIGVISLGPTGVFGIEILSSSEDALKSALEKVMELYEKEGVIEETLRDGHNRQEILTLLKGSIDEQLEVLKSKETIAFLIPEEKTSLMIGPKGAVIRDLEAEHSVKIIVEKPDAPYFQTGRAVLVRGEVKNIAECFVSVMEKIFKRENIDPCVVCLLPAGVPKYLIGYSGETIKRVEQETGCKLKVERAAVHPDVPLSGEENELQYCQIRGTRGNIVRGILGVATRILLQLSIQGQTSEATIPYNCDFGRFIGSGRSRNVKRPLVSEQRIIRDMRPVRESYAPNRAHHLGGRDYVAPVERMRVFDDVVPVRPLESQMRHEYVLEHGYPRGTRERHSREMHPHEMQSRDMQQTREAHFRNAIPHGSPNRGYGLSRDTKRLPVALSGQRRNYY